MNRPLRSIETLVVAGVLAMGLTGCDKGGDDGPGSFDGRVEGGAVAAVVLELQGTGIESMSGAGTTRAIHARVGQAGAGGIETHRLVLIAEGTDPIRFEVRVRDVSMGAPSAAVISAADADDEMLPSVGDVAVSLHR